MAHIGRCLGSILAAIATSAAIPVSTGSVHATNDATPQTWFRHAAEMMNIRMPGSAPFRMTAHFHAYPGMDFAKKGKSTILTGDGTYDETWLSPNVWRREMTFSGYHAVEVHNSAARKYQADSDYEPSRVLMMLDALLYPVPLDDYSPEYRESREDWKVEQLTAGTIPYVTLTHRERGLSDNWFYFFYAFLPNGMLVRSNYLGLVTSWNQDKDFAGMAVPQHFEIQAMGKTLLTADVAIAPAGETNPQLFDLSGSPASPGLTMRPFHPFEINHAEVHDFCTGLGPGPLGVIREIIGRDGQARETEVIDGPEPADNKQLVDCLRGKRYYPAKVDGDPCEEIRWYLA